MNKDIPSLPNNIDAEKWALGSMIFNKESIVSAQPILTPSDFYRKDHQVIYEHIICLIEKGINVDFVTLVEELKKHNKLKDVGGASYLTTIMDTVPIANNIKEYCQIIKEKSILRNIQIALNHAISLCQQEKDPQVILEHVNQISKNTQIIKDDKTLKQLFKETLMSSLGGVKYHFRLHPLNYVLGGIDQAEIVTIGGYTSQGKTSLAIQLCKDFCEDRLRVLYCTAEMSEIETARRLLANWQEKNLMDFRRGIFTENEKESLGELAEMMVNTWKLTIAKVYTVSDIRNLVYKHEPQILFIDYIQNLYRENEKSDYQKVTHDMQDIQILTRENNLVTFVLSQLSRNKEEIRKPRLNDLRDSGAIEEKSNIVLFVYWEERLKQNVEERTGKEPPETLEVVVAKNRDGTIGTITLDYYPEFSKITSQEKYRQ
jgi:replicative DNA helicase